MKVPGLDLFDPRASSMDSDLTSLSQGGSSDQNFGFAFNDVKFSDRVLRIEILADPAIETPVPNSSAALAGRVSVRRKRRCVSDARTEDALDIDSQSEEHSLDIKSDSACGVDNKNHDDDKILLIEDSPPGDKILDSDDSNCSEDGWNVLRVETLHISSLILAAKSHFFFKLFSNGMKESGQRHVTMRIHAREEVAVMELLNFMYTSTLRIATPPALLDVLMAADKFEVSSCMRQCCRLLKNLPMTPESALLYLELPSSILISDAVKPLTDAAKHFLANHYKDMSKHLDELMKLPLAGVEAVLSSNDLQAGYEDFVFDFALKWARTYYPILEERRSVLRSLSLYIRFSYMSPRKLRRVLSYTDFDQEFIARVVMDALFFKVESPHRQQAYATEEVRCRYTERDYKYRPVKVVELDLPQPQCVVYLDLKREECTNLFPSGRIYSQAFHLGAAGFFLSAHCNIDQQSAYYCFGLFLGMQEKCSLSFAVEYEFSARSKPTQEFVGKYRGNYTFTGGKAVGYRNLFSTPWSYFVAEDSNYFINGILHLRAELTIKREIAIES